MIFTWSAPCRICSRAALRPSLTPPDTHMEKAMALQHSQVRPDTSVPRRAHLGNPVPIDPDLKARLQGADLRLEQGEIAEKIAHARASVALVGHTMPKAVACNRVDRLGSPR